MLTSLSFLNIGATWPPPAERDRLQLYQTNRDLFEGRHDQVFTDWIRLLRDDQQATLELILNWPKRLSTLFADLLLGEPPKVQAGDEGSQEQEALIRIIESNGLFNTIYEVALDVSRFGVGLLKVRFDGRAIIEAQMPSVWYPVVRPDNVKDVTHHVLAWDYTVGDGDQAQRFLKVEIHEKGKITSKVYKLAGANIAGTTSTIMSLAEAETVTATGVDGFLVVPVMNLSTSDRYTGLDDYSDLDTILQELEVRIAQVSRILDKHSDPNLYGPDSALEQDPKTGQWIFRGGGKFYPVAPGEQPPGYVTWDGQLEAAFREIELLMDHFYTLSETSAAAFGQLKAGLAESGSALRRLMMAPLAKVNRIRLRFDPALRRTLTLAAALEAAQRMSGAVRVEDVSVTWRDGLPDDEVEQTTIETQRMSAGLTSLESALQRLDGLEGEALAAEVARIRADQASSRAAAPEQNPGLNITLPAAEGGEV